MNNYLIKVTERHSDSVWVEAETEQEAKDLAVYEAECQFECVYDAEVICVESEDSHG